MSNSKQYNGITVVLQWCYSGVSRVTVVLQWCYSGITVALQWFYSGVAVVLRWYYSGITVVSQWHYSGATVVLQYNEFAPLPEGGVRILLLDLGLHDLAEEHKTAQASLNVIFS
jgi:hypothetical protein